MKKQTIQAWVSDSVAKAMESHPKLNNVDIGLKLDDPKSNPMADILNTIRNMSEQQKIIALKASQCGSSCTDAAIELLAKKTNDLHIS